MGDGDDSILPLIERETPLLDAFRNRGSNNSLSSDVGELLGEVVLEDDSEFIEEQRSTFEEKFRASFADEVGVDEEDVDDDFVRGVSHLIFGTELSDTLSEDMLDEVGLGDEDEDEEDEDGDDDEEEEEPEDLSF